MGPVTVLVIRGDKNMKHVFLHRTILGSVIAAAVLYAALTLIAIETHAQLLTKLPTLTVVDADGVMVGTVLGFEHGAGLAGTVPFVSFEVDGTLLLIAVAGLPGAALPRTIPRDGARNTTPSPYNPESAQGPSPRNSRDGPSGPQVPRTPCVCGL
jgi:hypothetical protein